MREGTTTESQNLCPSERNPPDIPPDIHSPGTNASELVVERKWWKGHGFLYKHKPERPQDELTTETDETVLSELVKNPSETTCPNNF